MPQALSNDLRERVVAFVEAGHSCHEAAQHFDTSVSFAVNLMALYRETGSVAPRPNGGKRHGKLDPVESFLLAHVKRTPDVTMPELAGLLHAEKGLEVAPPVSVALAHQEGLQLQKKHCGQASKTGLNWPRSALNGKRHASPSCATSEVA